ncbi:hypothetical protein NHQ30_006153 [Ciborinia camelliae]|nr:hypothetical protein NHQ30_006153 [Ciborinia camelliae]
MRIQYLFAIPILASYAIAAAIPKDFSARSIDVDEKLANSWGASAGNSASVERDVDEVLANSWSAAAGNAA